MPIVKIIFKPIATRLKRTKVHLSIYCFSLYSLHLVPKTKIYSFNPSVLVYRDFRCGIEPLVHKGTQSCCYIKMEIAIYSTL